jgi:hypothetical protein
LAYDSTTHGWTVWLLHRTVLKNVDNGSFKVVLRSAGALLSNLEIAVIDASLINGTKTLSTCMFRNEDCRLRRDLGVGKSYEFVMWIEQGIFFSAIGGCMLTHSVGSFSDVGIDEPKHDVLRCEFIFDAL